MELRTSSFVHNVMFLYYTGPVTASLLKKCHCSE